MFYHFRQNNSGGIFCKPAINVIVEAGSAAEANRRAEELGLYFDGCANGRDCDCCGDRWYPQWDEKEGNNVPSVYDEPVCKVTEDSYVAGMRENVPFALVYYAEGRKKVYKAAAKKNSKAKVR